MIIFSHNSYAGSKHRLLCNVNNYCSTSGTHYYSGVISFDNKHYLYNNDKKYNESSLQYGLEQFI